MENGVILHTNRFAAIINGEDTLGTDVNEAFIRIHDSLSTEVIEIIRDTIHKKIVIEPEYSAKYYLLNVPTLGLLALLNSDNPDYHEYPERVYVDLIDLDNPVLSGTQKRHKKGSLFLNLTFPYFNHFLLFPAQENRYKSNFGYLGISLNTDIYHTNNQFLNLSLSGATDYEIILPGPLYVTGYYESMSSTEYSLTNNHRFGKLSLGYGLVYAWNTWYISYTDYYYNDETPDHYEKTRSGFGSHTSVAWGLIFPAYIHTSDLFYIGLIYKPTFFRVDAEPNFKYEHVISIAFGFKLKYGNISL